MLKSDKSKNSPKEKGKTKRVTVKDLNVKIKELENKILLKTADLENYRRRIQKEINDTRTFAQISVIDKILSIYDLFKMAVQASEEEKADLNTLKQGLTMINAEFTKVLDELGIKEIQALGEEFNHKLHEALSEEESKEAKGKVIKQYKCGYKMHERLIRAASVVVSKGEKNS